MDIWGQKCGPYLQTLHFLLMLGATISPQMVKLFLNTNEKPNFNRTVNVNTSQIDVHLQNSSMSNATLYGNLLPTFGVEYETKVHNVYLCLSIMVFLGTVLHIVNLCYSRCNVKHIHIDCHKLSEPSRTCSNPENINGHGKRGSKRHTFVALGLLYLIVVAFAALEEIFGAFSVKFSVEELKWNTGMGRDLVSAFWGATATSRLISIFISYWIEPKILTGLCTFLATLFTITFTLTINLTDVSLWLGIILIGLSIGSLLPTIINMGKGLIAHNGILSSVVFFSVYFGKIVTPPLVGYLLQNVSYKWFLYSSVIFAFLMFLNFCILFLLGRCNVSKEHSSRILNANQPS